MHPVFARHGGSHDVCRVPFMTQPDSEARALLDQWGANPARPVQELTAEDVRREDLAVLDLQRTPGDLYSVEDVEAPGPAGTLRVRLYRPHPGRLHPVLFLHGGGFVIGGEGYDSPLCQLALASGCLIVSPECRLAPEHPFPAALDDAEAAARWLYAEAPGLGAYDTSPAMAGDSSGGNLAAAVTHALSREGTPPSFQLLIYPMLDATASSASYEEFAEGYGFSSDKSRWYFDQYLPPGVDRHAPRVSPLFERGPQRRPGHADRDRRMRPASRRRRTLRQGSPRGWRSSGAAPLPGHDSRLLPDDRRARRLTAAAP